MQSPSKKGPLRFVNRLRTHPVNADLIAYRDGELASRTRAAVKRHLERCERCRKELVLIEEDLLHFGQLANRIEPDSDTLMNKGMFDLQQAMERHDAKLDQAPSTSLAITPAAEVLASVRKELAIYLGARAAEQFLAEAQSRSFVAQDLVSLVEPLMVGLLGNQGGSAVAGRVALLCKSASMPAHHTVT